MKITCRGVVLAVALLAGVPECMAANVVTSYTCDYETTSQKGWFKLMFGEELLYDLDTQTSEPRKTGIDPMDANGGGLFVLNFAQSVTRAFDTLENVIANEPGRQIRVKCVFSYAPSKVTGAAADPWWGYSLKWGDLAGSDPGLAQTTARVNNVENVWKYGETSANGFADVTITFYSPTQFDSLTGSFGNFWVDGSTESFRGVDVETVTLHEMGHALGFHSGMGFEDLTVSAMDTLMVSRESSLPGGGTEWLFEGQAATFVNGGEMVQMMPGPDRYDPHVKTPRGVLMNDGTQDSAALRSFTELDLAVLQDLGWTLANPIALPAVPEPSTATLSLLALAGLSARRRRRE